MSIGRSAVAALLAICVARQTAGEPAKPESGPEGHLLTQLVGVINDTNRERQAAFLSQNLAPSALAAMPLTEWSALVDGVRSGSGGIDVLFSDHPQNPAAVRVKARSGRAWARVYLFGSADGKIRDFGVIPTRDPAASLHWPNGRGTEAQIVAAIRENVGKVVADGSFSGVVSVRRGDTTLFEDAYGMAERAFVVPNKVDTKFNLASMNKMFTAVAIVQLVEAGKVHLDDRIADLIPEWPQQPPASKITVRHLLRHQGGLGMLFERPRWEPRRIYASHSELLPLFMSEPLMFEPGSRSMYSNEGYVTLGAVVERVSGVDYYAYVRDHILVPSGMSDTASYALDDIVPNRAVGYRLATDDLLGIAPRISNYTFLGARGNACGGGYSTSHDLHRFADALRGYRLLSKEMTELITSPNGPGEYGYGFQVKNVEGKSVRGHSGGGPGSGVTSYLWMIWGTPYTVVVLSNFDAGAVEELQSGIVAMLARE